jgi:hypothetical protein
MKKLIFLLSMLFACLFIEAQIPVRDYDSITIPTAGNTTIYYIMNKTPFPWSITFNLNSLTADSCTLAVGTCPNNTSTFFEYLWMDLNLNGVNDFPILLATADKVKTYGSESFPYDYLGIRVYNKNASVAGKIYYWRTWFK